MTKTVKYVHRKPTFKTAKWAKTYSSKVNGSKTRNVNYAWREVAKIMGVSMPQFTAFIIRMGIARYDDVGANGKQRIMMNGKFSDMKLGEMYFAQNKKTGQSYSQGVVTEKGMDFIEKYYSKILKCMADGQSLNVALWNNPVKSFTQLV